MKKMKLDTNFEKKNQTMDNTLIKEENNDKIQKECALIDAVDTGDYERLGKLLSLGISVEAENLRSSNAKENSKTPLQIAVILGHVKCVEILISYGADLKAKDKFDCTAVHLASQYGDYSCLKMLLEAGADYSVPIDTPFFLTKISYVKGMTALHLAAKYNHVDCVKELIQFGANCNAVDVNGCTSLYLAAKAGYWDCVLTHLKHARDTSFISFPCYHTSNIPLHFAVKRGMLECVKQLVNLGSDVNHMNRKRLSPLLLACRSNTELKRDLRIQILKILVLDGHNANLNNALHHIFDENKAEVKAFLIAYGANVNIKNEKSLTLLEYELKWQRNFDLIKCIANCKLQLPHLKSLNLFSTAAPLPREHIILDNLDISEDMSIQLFREERDMFIEISDSYFQLKHLFLESLSPSTPPMNTIKRLVPLRQPFLNFAYEYVCDELKKLEHISLDGGLENCLLKDVFDVTDLLLKDKLLQLKQQLWYEKMASNPRTLQHSCRFTIRDCIGSSNLKHIKKLPLPDKLLSYLLLECDV